MHYLRRPYPGHHPGHHQRLPHNLEHVFQCSHNSGVWLPRTTFDVTGIQAISNRNVVHVCEGGKLDIFDTTTDVLSATQIDIVGKALDIVQIDP